MKILCFISLMLSNLTSSAQAISYGKFVVDTLCSPRFLGRGYVNGGDSLAALFIASEFKNAGLKTHFPNFLQPFYLNVNTFPGALELKIDGLLKTPGKDYIVSPYSESIKGEFEVKSIHKRNYKKAIRTQKFAGQVVVLDKASFSKDLPLFQSFKTNPFGALGLISTSDKLTQSMSKVALPYFGLTLAATPKGFKKIELQIESEFLENKLTHNVVAYSKGTQYPDSFVVFTAHYDHLGPMGAETYFPGANDNASGTAMLLSLAKHYAKNPAKYTTVFIAFSGEEVGLLGSFHFVKSSPIDLNKIRFLVNMDIFGTGEEGIKIVNSTIFKEELSALEEINQRKNYVKSIQTRGEAANSDHYPFYAKGVPCFFIYTLGGIAAYHDVYDVSSTLPLTEFDDIYRLLVEFTEVL